MYTHAPDGTWPVVMVPPWPLAPFSSAYSFASAFCEYASDIACVAMASIAGFELSAISRVMVNRPETAFGVTVLVPMVSAPTVGFVPSVWLPAIPELEVYAGIVNGVASDRVPRDTEPHRGRPCSSCVT